MRVIIRLTADYELILEDPRSTQNYSNTFNVICDRF